MKFKIAVPFLLVMVLLAGCANKSFLQTSYGVMAAGQTTYDKGMTEVRAWQDQGLISPAQRDVINKAAKIYKNSHNIAVDALAVYKKSLTITDQNIYITALSAAVTNWADFAKLINAIKPGTVPASLLN